MRVRIPADARVLDVGSGHVPLPRADVLLEKYPDRDAERSGAVIDVADPRLVIGDAEAMPFATGEFDYALASHVAEHATDPIAFCAELARVARARCIEALGWLGDRLLREPFHPWRVRQRGEGLEFTWVEGDPGFGWLSELVYAAVYLGEERPSHRTIVARSRSARLFAQAWRVGVKLMPRLVIVVDTMYTRFEWRDRIPCTVRRV